MRQIVGYYSWTIGGASWIHGLLVVRREAEESLLVRGESEARLPALGLFLRSALEGRFAAYKQCSDTQCCTIAVF